MWPGFSLCSGSACWSPVGWVHGPHGCWGHAGKYRLILVVSFHSADVSGIDWMVRHGRSLALSVAVNVAPGRLCAGRYSSDVQEMILSSATADRVRHLGSQTSPLPPLGHIP